MNNNGEVFLDIIYRNIYNSLSFSDKEKGERREESIKRYLARLEEMHRRAREPRHNKIDVVKTLYYDKYVIKKKDIPDYISENEKERIIEAQKKTLGAWIDYLTDENALYPMWAKYWIFQQMLKIGTYDEMSGKYTKRSKTTTNTFIEVNPEIIAKCIENITELLGNEKQNSQQIRKSVSDVSFEKMYIEYLKKHKEHVKKNDGIWIKYNQGNKEEARKLFESLNGYDTKWCTASENYAINQICGGGNYPGGDFYVYYTIDENGEYKVPRIAIRLNGHSNIAEIRGIEEHQNLEEDMVDVLEVKLREMKFLDKKDVEQNLATVNDLRELSIIKQKALNNIQLTPKEVIDLYTKKYGFGWELDPLIKKIAAKRDIMEDFKIIVAFNINKLALLPFIREYGLLINDREVASKLLPGCANILRYVDPKMEGFKEMVLDGVREKWIDIVFLNPNIENYKEILLEAVRINGLQLPDFVIDGMYVPDLVGEDFYRELSLEAVRQNGNAMRHVPSYIKGYKEIAIEAVRQNDEALKYVDKKIAVELRKMMEQDSEEINMNNNDNNIRDSSLKSLKNNDDIPNVDKEDDTEKKENIKRKKSNWLQNIKDYFMNFNKNREKRR